MENERLHNHPNLCTRKGPVGVVALIFSTTYIAGTILQHNYKITGHVAIMINEQNTDIKY